MKNCALVLTLLAFATSPLYAGYAVNPTSTTAGTDSSGASSSVLKLEVTSVSNSSYYVTFKVSKANGGAFTTAGTIYIKKDCGSSSCQTVASTSIAAGLYYKTFNVYMPTYVTATGGKDFYGRYYTSSNGFWSYAGPIHVYTPSLNTPGSTSTSSITSSSAYLGWGSVSGANTYRYQVTDQSSFSTSSDGSTCYNCVANSTTSSSAASVSGLDSATTHRWRVRAGSTVTGQGSLWSSERIFTTVTPSVSSVSPSSATLGQLTTFTVYGTNLTSSMGFWLDDCPSVQKLGGSTTYQQFRCTPSYTTGSKPGIVYTKDGGSALKNFSVTVLTNMSVSSVSPTTVTLDQLTTFTVYGSNLTSGMGFWVDECDGTQELSGSTTYRQFRCTPRRELGAHGGVVKDEPDGTTLKSFSVNVTTPLSVSRVEPLQVAANTLTEFTVHGSNLTSGMGFSVDWCASVQELSGGTSIERHFRCTQGSSLGTKGGKVETTPGGATLHNFSVNVVTLPTVTDVKPVRAAYGVPTTFTVTGSNLPTNLGFWVHQCEGVQEIAGGDTTERFFRCTPSTSLGTKAGAVNVAVGGTGLHAFEVEVVTPLPTVTEVLPIQAALDTLTTYTVKGTGLLDDMAFWVDECDNVQELAGGDSTEQKFTCTPRRELGSQGGAVKLAAKGTQLEAFSVNVVTPPTVTDVKPVRAAFGVSTTFTVSGSNLPTNLGFWVHQCEGVQEIAGGDTTERFFRCTPSTSLGPKDGAVNVGVGGTAVDTFNVEVITAPSVSSVSPLTATLNVPQTFTVTGSNLPTGLAFWVDECVSPVELAGGTSTTRQFRCTPSYTTGVQLGSVKVAEKGSVLESFQVTVAGPPVVTSVSPLTATINTLTTFTVNGSNLTSGMGFWVDQCAGVTEIGGTSTYRQFRCTPSDSTGTKAGVVKDAEGVDLHYFNVEVSTASGTTYLNVSDWAQSAADYLVQNGILEDPPDHDLRGTSPGNRAETATMLYRALGGGMSAADTNFANWYGSTLRPVFSDVNDPDIWYFDEATYLGMLAYDDTTTAFNRQPCIFRPGATISRAWVLKALLETWNVAPLTNFSGVSVFDDVPTNHEAAPYVYAAQQEGLISGDGVGNTYRPNDPVNREDIFVMLHRVFEASVNTASKSVPKPVPTADDFVAYGGCSRIGYRYEQPVLQGVQPPSASISATALQWTDLGNLGFAYASTLDALITGLDPNTYTDANGVTHQAGAFCAWDADGGAFVDLDPANAEPYCNVRWIAPIDATAGSVFTITLYVGDGLGSEVRDTVTLTVPGVPSDPTTPNVTIDPLPAGLVEGQVVDVAGDVADGGTDDGSVDFGILRVALSYSIDGGANWSDLGHAELFVGSRWSYRWFLPHVSGNVLLRAEALNLRGNAATATTSSIVEALLSIDVTVVDSYGQPMENAYVILSGGGLKIGYLADNLGHVRFTSTGDGLTPGTSYRIDANRDGRTAFADGLVPTAEQSALDAVLHLDTAPPLTAASPAGDSSTEPQTVTLTCSDDRSGCAATYYTVDGSTPTTSSPVYSGPIPVANTTLQFFSVDQAGNPENVRVEVYISPIRHDLSISTNGSGTGSVLILPDGTSCATACTATYPENTTLTLSPSAANGSVFAGWSGDCAGTGSCTVTMDGTKTVTATFASCAEPTLDRFNVLAGRDGSSVAVNVDIPPGCPWTAVSDAPFVTVTSGASGSGPGAVTLTVAQNTPGIYRLGMVTIAEKTFMVRQSGVQLGAGGNHSAVLQEDGTVLAWGNNDRGQLGDGTTAQRSYPSPVLDGAGNVLSGIAAISTKTGHNLFITENGNVLANGINTYGQAGDASLADRHFPGPVMDGLGQPLTSVVDVAVGESHSVALLADGSVVAWGYGGRLGDGTLDHRTSAVPVVYADGTPVREAVAIVAGYAHSHALLADGTVIGWGINGVGQIADGTVINPRKSAVPVLVEVDRSREGMLAFAGGRGFGFARDPNGVLTSWGGSTYGQRGSGTTAQSSIPTPVLETNGSNVPDALAADGGYYHALALREDGTMLAWGRNHKGQLGDGTVTDRLRAIPVVDANDNPIGGVVRVDVGSYHNLALLTDKTLLTWGYNGKGQLGDGTQADRHHPVVANGVGAQLGVTLTDTPDPVDALATVQLTVGVVNLGRGTATGVTVNITTDGAILNASGNGWACTVAATATCTAATLGLGPASPITIHVQASNESGTMQHTVLVSANEADPWTADNTATASTTVRGVADLRPEIFLPHVAMPDLPFNGTVVIHNDGPSTATAVTLTLTGTLDVLSPTTVVVGTLAAGTSATVPVSLSSNVLGDRTLEATVTATENDPVANNTASASILVNKDGLSGYWPFDETDGDVALDATGRGNDGTIYGTVRTAGIHGGALDFTGDSNRVRLPLDMSNYVEDQFTVSLWTKVTSVKSINYLFHDNDDRPGIRLNGENRPIFSHRPNGTTDPFPIGTAYDSRVPLPVGEWMHLAVRWDGTNYSGYIDGHLVYSVELPYFQLGSRLMVGSDGGTVRSLDGLMDEVRIYNRPLADREIQALATDLVGHWKLDEAFGDVVLDSSGNRNDGLLVNYSGNVWQRTEGAVGGAVDLLGTNYVAIPDDGSLSISGAMTVEAWVQVRTSPTRIVHKTASFSNNADNYTVATNGLGQFLLHVEDSATGTDWTATSTTVAQPDTWHHVAGVYDGQNLMIYVDGVLEDVTSPGPIVPFTGPADLILGTNQFTTHGNRYWTDGLIDDVRIYRRGLSAEEIARHAEATVGWWRFEEAEGTRVLDSSGNFHDGEINTVSGTPWQRVAGVVGQGLDFTDGQNEVRVPNDGSFDLARPFTIETWLKARQPFARAIVKTAEEGANKDNYSLATDDTGLHLLHVERSSDGEDLGAWSATASCASRFHHVAGTFDGEALDIYVDGVLEGTTAPGPFVPYTGSYDLLLGTNVHPGRNNPHWTDGILDEVAIHARPLSAAAIAARAAAGPVYPPSSGAILSPSGSVEGSFTVDAEAFDGDGLAVVQITFVPGGPPLVLCDLETLCPGDNGSWAVVGVDPRDYGVTAGGTLTLTLTVVDACGDRVDVAQRTIDWMPTNTPTSGSILQPSGPVAGEVAVTASADDADGLRRSELTFVDGGVPLVLCDDAGALPCSGTDGTWLASVDPRSYGVAGPGPVTLRLFVTDDRSVLSEVASVTFDWSPEAFCRDDLEGGTGVWTAASGASDSGTSAWALSDMESFSPSHSLHVSAMPGQEQLLLMTELLIPAEDLNARLRFQHRVVTTGPESGGVLEISTDGASWFDVLDGHGADVAANPGRLLSGGYISSLACCATPLSGRSAWTSTAGWEAVEVDLADFAGRTIQLRWRFAASDAAASDGWSIDDVELVFVPSCPLLGIFTDGFESGDASRWSSSVP